MLTLTGLFMWLSMERQEDPRLPDYWGLAVTPYPGADAETVERLVLDPIEDSLMQVDQIKVIEATAFEEMTVVQIELRGDTDDFDQAWADIRLALNRAQADFPAGAGPTALNEDLQDQDSVVLALTGSSDVMDLLQGAHYLKDRLLRVPAVSKIHLVADPEEQVTIALDDAVAFRLGVSPRQVAAQLSARNRIVPGGSIKIADKTVRLRPLSEFKSAAEISATPIVLPTGQTTPLGEIARVYQGPREPASALMRYNGEMAVGVAVVPRKNVNLVHFGREVQRALEVMQAHLRPLNIHRVTFQPKRTELRLKELSRALILGMMIVAAVLIMAMGLRLGLLVAAVIPLVTLTSLTLFSWGGGVLHQISIAALVLALGMLVDNAIVVAENIQWHLDRGQSREKALVTAVKDLAVPLAGATATTLAAFIPMLVSRGPTAAFTRSIPVVMMLTLTVSYLFALGVTPLLSQIFLRPRKAAAGPVFERVGERLARLAWHHHGWVILGAALLVGLTAAGASKVEQQFFPTSDRNQLLVDIKLPEGSHLDATAAAARRLETALLGRSDIRSVASFMGRGAPHFYYNVQRVPFSPHFAQLIVETPSKQSIDAVLSWIRHYAATALAHIEVVVRKLEQGPPVGAPVEVRLYGDQLSALNNAAQMVGEALRATDGTTDVRHDLGPGAPTLRFTIDDAVAARHGLNRLDVARALYGHTRGLSVGELYIGEDPVPVLVRSSAGERLPMATLEAIDVATVSGQRVPVSQVARLDLAWRPAAIKHRQGRRVVTVSAQLLEGATFSGILKELTPALDQLSLPPGVTIGFGGDAEGSVAANGALLRTLPLGLIVLMGVLLAEFNSFRRVGLILLTVPLCAAGIIPGLILGRQPFGFMSLLGVFALVGIVVNNAIVLLEVVEERRRDGVDIQSALRDAVARRIRPILLTTATTVAGLMPLAFSSSTLWPPLAFAMISGLTASTFLTLVLIPAVYRLLLGHRGGSKTATHANDKGTDQKVLLPNRYWLKPCRGRERSAQ
jgi:multidrug efflux pump subunit AcrB